MDITDTVAVLQRLVRCESETPQDGGSLALIESWLQEMDFTTMRVPFGEGAAHVDNLYGRLGDGKGGLLFLGHVDVVPAGDLSLWTRPPFAGEICQWQDEGQVMVGRGTTDMKGGVAAFLASLARIHKTRSLHALNMPLSFFVTSDEEGTALNGSAKALRYLYEQGERWDFCLNGEPTSQETLGDLIKIGRRGSLHGKLKTYGVQGHTGYIDLADNAAHRLWRLLTCLLVTSFDKGNDYFEPSSFSITKIEVANDASNVVPGYASANFNIRFNDTHTGQSLTALLEKLLQSVGEPQDRYTLEVACHAESFLTTPQSEVEILSSVCEDVLGVKPRLGTDGGTSDSRFARDYVAVADFGLTGKTMHAINERVSLAELEQVTEIYKIFVERYAEKGYKYNSVSE